MKKLLRQYANNTDSKMMRVLMAVASTCFFVLLVVTILRYQESGRYWPGRGYGTGPAPPPFDFVPPAPQNLDDCEMLFGPKTAAAGFQMSTEYQRRLGEFEAAVNRSVKEEQVEGNSFQQPTEFKTLHYLASRKTVRTICETGFNLGHSTFSHLTANSHAIVHSFDLGEHGYAHRMAAYISDLFPGRFFIHFGDSTRTVPEFVRANPNVRCDLLIVDGGHTYPVAMEDLLNLAAMANTDGSDIGGNVIVFDDYPTKKAFDRPFGWAWENMVRWGYVHETLRCSFANRQFQRGFVVGVVMRRPATP